MRCTVCGFEAGRDVVAVLNIERRACEVLGNPAFFPTGDLNAELINLNPLVRFLMGCRLGGRPRAFDMGGTPASPTAPQMTDETPTNGGNQ